MPRPIPRRAPVTSATGLRFISLVPAASSAARNRSGVAGACRTRTPVACAIALKIAGAVGISAGSPTPFAPCGPSGSGSSIRITSIGGTSPNVGMR